MSSLNEKAFEKKMEKRQQRMLIVGSIVSIFFLVVVGICLFGRIRNVSVNGCSYYTEEEITDKVIKTGLDHNSFALYFKYACGKGEDIPFVEKVDVQLKGLGSVQIQIWEKTIIGCIKYMGEYLYFDRDGVVVESTVKQQEGIPLVEGVTFRRMNLYEKMEVENDEIFERIMGVSQLLSKYQIATDKVVFDQSSKVTLYVEDIRILLGKRDSYDEQIAELSELLPKARKKKLKGTLDMESFWEGQEQIIFKMDLSNKNK